MNPSTDLLWPGDDRAGHHFTDQSLLDAMLRVESAWLDALVAANVAPETAQATLAAPPLERVAAGSEAGGNPVIPLVNAVRTSLPEPAATWLHRGLTSQDVLDTALILCAREATDAIRANLLRLVDACGALVDAHRHTVMAGRTLTQHATPTTFGLVAAQWLAGALDAIDEIATLTFPVQIGGAAGTRAAVVELAGIDRADQLVEQTAAALGLNPASPWHNVRTPITRIGDAAVRSTDTCGHTAADILVLARTEIAEVSEGAPGGSSTMPGKANPVLSSLIRRAALTTPGLAAQLHLASADAHDQRTAGSWHAEGAVLRDLLRRTITATDQTADLVAGLQVNTAAMPERAAAADEALRAEQRSMSGITGRDPQPTYLGAADALIDAVLTRAKALS